MEEHFQTFAQIAALSAAIFGITLLIILRKVRTENYEYVASQAEMNTVFWPRIKLKASWGFFVWAYKEYYRIKHSKILIICSLTALGVEIAAFVCSMVVLFL